MMQYNFDPSQLHGVHIFIRFSVDHITKMSVTQDRIASNDWMRVNDEGERM